MNSPSDPDRDCKDGKARCELEANVDILRRVQSFSSLPLDRLKLYAYLSKRMKYRSGEFVFRHGDTDDRGYIIISGKVQVIREYKDHSFLVNEFKEGDFFGGLALFSNIRRLFSARAVTNLECLTMDRETFRKILAQFPEVSVKLLDVLIERIVAMEERLFDADIHDRLYG